MTRLLLAGGLLPLVVALATAADAAEATRHPFLICTADQFDALRARAEQEPWQSMAASAIKQSDAGLPKGSARVLNYYLGAAALAALVDPERAELHAGRVRDAICGAVAELQIENGNWLHLTRECGAIFVAVLALDLVHDWLTADEVAACEAALTATLEKVNRRGAWEQARQGAWGVWEVYTGRRTEPDDAYFNSIQQQITDDGVTPVTIHYAYSRIAGDDDRPVKSAYMDVLEFTGIDRRYYSDPRIQKFFRWLFGIAITPQREHPLLGDTGYYHSPGNHLTYWRIENFDREAAEHLAWHLQGQQPRGHLLPYILMRQPLPPPRLPRSQLYPDGGGFFREPVDEPISLHAVLYNIKGRDEWHTHQETNAVTFSALGSRLLVNGGRLGPPFTEAPRQNVMTIDGQNHASRHGAGLTEGLTSVGCDYAQGDSGSALAGARQLRSLVMIHRQDGQPGYFVVLDEVTCSPTARVSAYWQLAATRPPTTLVADTAYQATIDWRPKQPGVELTTFLATPPAAVETTAMVFGQSQIEHQRLEAVYQPDATGRVTAATILFPHDATHSRPAMARLTAGQGHGAVMDFGGGCQDLLLVGTEPEAASVGPATCQAGAALWRLDGDRLRFVFAQRLSRFEASGWRLHSDQPVSLHLRGGRGQVESGGATLTLAAPGLRGMRLGTTSLAPLEAGEDWLKVAVPAGRHDLLLEGVATE